MIYAKSVETNILIDTSKIKDATADTSNYVRLTFFVSIVWDSQTMDEESK